MIHHPSTLRSRPRRNMALFLSSRPDSNQNNNESNQNDSNDDDTNCQDEEECEIDWSLMPGAELDPMDALEEPSSSSSSPLPSLEDLERLYDNAPDFSPELEIMYQAEQLEKLLALTAVGCHVRENIAPTETYATITEMRNRLEIQWQIMIQDEECDVERPQTCGGRECASCHGTGSCPCRFCHGSGHIELRASSSSSSSSSSESQTNTQTFTVPCSICTNGHETCKACQGSGWVAEWTDSGVHAGGSNK
jgi:hypothetical protein